MSAHADVAADLAVCQALVGVAALDLRRRTAERDEAIRAARAGGASLEEIATATGLTVGRVSQIARAGG